jgi:hypothetical protein
MGAENSIKRPLRLPMLKIYALSGMYEGLAKREEAVIIVKGDQTPLPLTGWLARFSCRDTRE